MAYDEGLAERLRERLRGDAGVDERKMFGGLAFLSNGHLLVGVLGDDLIARVDPVAVEVAAGRPGVRPFDVTGRPMRGWFFVAGEVLDDDVLELWLGDARDLVAGLPPK